MWGVVDTSVDKYAATVRNMEAPLHPRCGGVVGKGNEGVSEVVNSDVN